MNREIQRHWDLFMILVEKEITLKYKRTYLGFAWSLLNPIFTALIYFLAFSVFMRFKMDNYALFLLSALFPWNWFAASVLMSVNTLTGNKDLIKRVIFPKHFLVLSLIAGQLATLLFSIPVLAIILIYSKGMPGIQWLYGIPILIIIQFLIISGISMAIAMINAFFRDLEYIVGVIMNMLFWMTPIIYPLDRIPEKFRLILSLNPMMYVVQSWRDLIMNNTINWEYIGISFVSALIFFLAGYFIFQRLSFKLDEVV